jgi:hypothetical protein
VKRECLCEGDVVNLMELLGEEVDGDVTTQKIRVETSPASNFNPTAAKLQSTPRADQNLERAEG